MSRPRALVLRAAGTNCDVELCRAFQLAGAQPELMHLDRVIERPGHLDSADLIAFAGGFSFGDDVASGRIFAVKTRERLYARLKTAAERGVPMIGVCNGFQILVQTGLLPGPAAGEPWPDTPPTQTVSLTENESARYIDDWIPVAVEPSTCCVWTEGLDAGAGPDILRLPIAHGEGRFVADEATLASLEASGQVALRYTDNPNGSVGAVAGICDPTGRIFGLMPHPERYVDWATHPFWTRLDEETRSADTPGLSIFKSAVAAAARQPA